MRGVTVRWAVEDGYVGGSPQPETIIDFQDWDDAQGEGPEAVARLIYDSIQEDFENRIAWFAKGDPQDPRS